MEKEMATHFSILALRTPWTVWKGKKIEHWKILRLVGDKYANGEEWRNNSRKNKGVDIWLQESGERAEIVGKG